MRSLQEIFNYWLTLPITKRTNLLQNKQFLVNLGKLAKLQDVQTGDTLLHIVLRSLNTLEVNNVNNIHNPSRQLLEKLCIDADCFGNMFLQNNALETPYDLYVSNDKINSIKPFIKKVRERQFYIASDTSDDSHTFNKVAKGALPANILRETLIRQEYQPGNNTKPINMLQAAALNGHDEFVAETHINFKVQKDGPEAAAEYQHIMAEALGLSAAVLVSAFTRTRIDSEDVNARADEMIKKHPMYAHSNPVLKFFNMRGNTYTVQEIFRQEKKKLIQQALNKYNEANHGNGAQIGNNEIGQYQATYQALAQLVQDRSSSSSKIIRKPLKPYDVRSWVSDDVDTESYQLIRNTLLAYENNNQDETIRCLRKLAVHAGLSEDYFDKETISEHAYSAMSQS